MTRYQVEAYKGTDNYIFVSYAHKDSGRVFPIIKRLQSRGYRIWYDEGIVPGSEWTEDIAAHLNDCAMVIAFVTPNSMGSINCRREINFALSKEKPFLSVALEPTEMPPGIEMQLSTQQSVIRQNYATAEMFLDKICAFPDMSRCCGQPAPVVVEEQPEPSQPEDPEAVRRQQIRDTVSRYGHIGASAAAGVGALILLIVTVLLFGNYHQENLLNYTSLPALPDWFAKILPGVWHQLPAISSPEYRNLGNLPAIAWWIGIGWFLKCVGGTFKRHTVAERMVQIQAVVRFAAIAGHIALCARVENAVQQTAPQWDTWLPYYFPVENLVAMAVMIAAGCVIGRIVNWIVLKVLRIVYKTEL